MRILKNQKGFTLIEGMIVACIIGILLAIVIPHFTDGEINIDIPISGEIYCKNGLAYIYTVQQGYQQQAGPNGGGVECGGENAY